MRCARMFPSLLNGRSIADAKSRQAHRSELLPILEEIFVRRDAAEWLDILHAAGVPTARVNRMPECVRGPERGG